jgi:hypothetical protein
MLINPEAFKAILFPALLLSSCDSFCAMQHRQTVVEVHVDFRPIVAFACGISVSSHAIPQEYQPFGDQRVIR